MTWNWVTLPKQTTLEQLIQRLNRQMKLLEQETELTTAAANGVGTFAVADTTPSVAYIGLGITANTGATTITTLDNGIKGQRVTIRFGDANTTLAHGSTLQLVGDTNFTGATGDMKMLETDDGTNWYEVPQPSVYG